MDEVEEIKRRIDIVDLISSYLTLKKAGANYRALCPFHNEKTPSLMVSPEKQIWHCFGCSEGGDVFSFVMKMENLEFREALEMLAERSGVKLKSRRPLSPDEKPDKKSRLFKINALSAQVFHKILTAHPAGKSALEYLKKRKLSNQTIKDFLIGYAPANKVLAPFLKKRGFTEQEIQNAGGPDRFYKRIIFPIRDIMGNVLGFTGRVLDPKQEPKYLNTPETIIFHKGGILFGLEKARGEIKLEKATVVVEGQMDVIASYQAGVKNVVATSGTALTPEHLQILFRYTPNIIFAFDSDTAGLVTAKKAYEQALSLGFNVKMVELGRYKDPGEMIAADPTTWQKAVQNSQPVIDWYFSLAFGEKSEARLQARIPKSEMTSVEKKEIAKEILPIIKKIPDTIEQAHFVGLLAKRLDVNEQIVFDALNRIQEKKERKLPQKHSIHKQLSSEEMILGLLIKNPSKIKTYIEKLKNYKGIDQDIYKALYNWYNKEAKGNLLDFLKKNLGLEKFSKIKLIILETETQYSPELIDQALQDIFKKSENTKKENLKERYAHEISIAEKEGNRERLKTLIKEFQDAISK
jgi:DNA primase